MLVCFALDPSESKGFAESVDRLVLFTRAGLSRSSVHLWRASHRWPSAQGDAGSSCSGIACDAESHLPAMYEALNIGGAKSMWSVDETGPPIKSNGGSPRIRAGVDRGYKHSGDAQNSPDGLVATIGSPAGTGASRSRLRSSAARRRRRSRRDAGGPSPNTPLCDCAPAPVIAHPDMRPGAPYHRGEGAHLWV